MESSVTATTQRDGCGTMSYGVPLGLSILNFDDVPGQ